MRLAEGHQASRSAGAGQAVEVASLCFALRKKGYNGRRSPVTREKRSGTEGSGWPQFIIKIIKSRRILIFSRFGVIFVGIKIKSDMKILTYIYMLLAVGLIAACTSAGANVDAIQASAKGTKTVTKKDTTPVLVSRATAERPNRNYITSKSRPKTEIKQTFPFDLALTDGVGNKTSTEEIFKKGKPTVVLFWLTTCYPCRVEMAAIKKKYAKWQDETDFNLVAISTDFEKNYDNYLKYVEKADWPWEAYHDSNREFRNVMPGELNGLPQTFIFDGNGEIAYHKRKFRSGDEDKLYNEIKKLAAR